MIVISTPTKSRAPTQFTAFPFASLCVFQGQILAAGPSGIFTLEGNTDNGAPIDAYLTLPDYRTGGSFRPHCVHIDGEGGPLDVTVTMDQGDPHTKRASSPKTGHHRKEVKPDRIYPGGSMALKIANVAGGDFAIDGLDVSFTNIGKRP